MKNTEWYSDTIIKMLGSEVAWHWQTTKWNKIQDSDMKDKFFKLHKQ